MNVKIHMIDRRLFCNAGMEFPVCHRNCKKGLDLDKCHLPLTNNFKRVTCKRCLKLQPQYYS